jgi:ABC-type multidrug transport system fused ATPase/permease subunit
MDDQVCFIKLILCNNIFPINLICCRQSVEVETQMTSVERVLEYCELDQEPPSQVPPKYRPPSNWPSHGHIIFDDVCMSHSKDPHALLALNHITLTIQPHEKIGIVGRTGAGKSSFIQTLFRMGTLVHGQITIDNIDISTVGLDDVRRRISIIPQDPVLFTGTMRSNLDQFGDYSDTEIWHALEQVSSSMTYLVRIDYLI